MSDPLAALERLASEPNLLALAERVRLSMAPPPQFSRDFAHHLNQELSPERWRSHTVLSRPKLLGIHEDPSGVDIHIGTTLVFYAANVLHRVTQAIAPKYPRAGLLDVYDEIPEIGLALAALAEERITWDQQLQSSRIWQEDAAEFHQVQALGPLEIYTFVVRADPPKTADRKVYQFPLRCSLKMRKKMQIG